MATQSFSMLPVDDIVFDSKQPRKFFDELAMKELTESVKEIGILQPIIVRPGATIGTGTKTAQRPGYIIISGERRYRAAYQAGLTEVPVVIREGLSDQEVLEIQITENLQRKDVNPMEEAVAFDQLLNSYTIEEIGHRVGKSAQFVAQRLSLMNLSDKWQQILFKGDITLTDAYKLARMGVDAQEEIYGSAVREDGEITDYVLKNALRNSDCLLKDATFDINDEKLHPTMGACTSCRFNSQANTLLFPDVERAVCSSPACFHKKTSLAFAANIEALAKDPNVLFLDNAYYHDKEMKAKLEEVRAMGVVVLSVDAFQVIEEPQYVGTLEEYIEEQKHEYEYEHYVKEEQEDLMREWKEDYQQLKKQYERELEQYKHDTANARDGFVVVGWNAGKQVIVKLISRKGSAPDNNVPADAASEMMELDRQIEEVKAKQKRNMELDREKVQERVNALFDKAYADDDSALSEIEENALIVAMCEKSYKTKHYVKELLGKVYYKSDNLHAAIKKSRGIVTVSNVARVFIVDMINPTYLDPARWDNAAAILDLATERFPKNVFDLASTQIDKSKKRDTNLQARLDALLAKKAELEEEVKREQNIEAGKKAQAKAKKK